MSKNWILKRALILVAACLTLAWVGAIYAAEGQTSSHVGTSPDGEGLQLIKSEAEGVIVELHTPLVE